MKTLFILPVACLLFMCGCSSIDTHYYADTRDVRSAVISKDAVSYPELSGKSLVVFVSNERKIQFQFANKTEIKKDSLYPAANVIIGDNVFSAFIVSPGQYSIQNKINLIFEKNNTYFFEVTNNAVTQISHDKFCKDFKNDTLSKESDSTSNNILLPVGIIHSTTEISHKVGYYTAGTIVYTVGAPFVIVGYTVVYTFKGLAWVAIAYYTGQRADDLLFDSTKTCNLELAYDDSVSYTQTKALSSQPQNIQYQGEYQAQRPANTTKMGTLEINNDTYGPGKNSDQYGRPVKYEVMGQPANTDLLKVKPNAYGLGVGMDQYGRPVKYEVMGQPKANTDLLKVKPNAYGLGVGMDQFGRPVKAKTEW